MICPRCQSAEHYILHGRKTVRCKQCSHDFSETSGTVWKSSKLDPQARQTVIDLLNEGKNRYAISVATGLQYNTVRLIAKRLKAEQQVVEPKREYCGPYLIALPPPAYIVKHIPTRAPYRIEKTRVADGRRWIDRICEDQRVAMAYLFDARPGVKAVLFDADASFIASFERKYIAGQQKYT